VPFPENQNAMSTHPETLFEYFILPPINDIFDLPDRHIVLLCNLLKRQTVNEPINHYLTIPRIMDPVVNQKDNLRIRIIVLRHLALILPVPLHILH
jgi:hypothetical protein